MVASQINKNRVFDFYLALDLSPTPITINKRYSISSFINLQNIITAYALQSFVMY